MHRCRSLPVQTPFSSSTPGPGFSIADDTRTLVAPVLERIVDRLGGTVPLLYYLRGGDHLLPVVGRLGFDAVSIDWRTPLAAARSTLGPDVTLQGNLDPACLLTSREVIGRSVEAMVPDGIGSLHRQPRSRNPSCYAGVPRPSLRRRREAPRSIEARGSGVVSGGEEAETCPAVAPPPSPHPALDRRGELGAGCVLEGHHATGRDSLACVSQQAREIPVHVGRVGEHEIETAPIGPPGIVGQQTLLDRPTFAWRDRAVGAQHPEDVTIRLEEGHLLRSTAQRFQPDRPAAGEQVKKASSGEKLPPDADQRLSDPRLGRPNAGRDPHAPSAQLAGAEAQSTASTQGRPAASTSTNVSLSAAREWNVRTG